MWPILTHQRQELNVLSPEKTVLLSLVTSPKMRKILTRMIPENDNHKTTLLPHIILWEEFMENLTTMVRPTNSATRR